MAMKQIDMVMDKVRKLAKKDCPGGWDPYVRVSSTSYSYAGVPTYEISVIWFDKFIEVSDQDAQSGMCKTLLDAFGKVCEKLNKMPRNEDGTYELTTRKEV